MEKYVWATILEILEWHLALIQLHHFVNLLWDPIEWYDDAISASSHSLMCTRSMMSPMQGGLEQEALARCTSSGRRTQRRNMLPSTRNSPATSWKKLYSQTPNNVQKNIGLDNILHILGEGRGQVSARVVWMQENCGHHRLLWEGRTQSDGARISRGRDI